MTVVAIGYRPPVETTTVASVADTSDTSPASTQTSVNEVVATTIAASMAETANLPVANNVANLSVSLAAKNELSQSDDATISKPQIVQATGDRRTIVTYVAKAGDTADSVAAQYGISKDTLKWANNLTSDAIDEGKELSVLPVDGVVYTVKEGDTIDSIADKYKASKERLTSFNDLELGGVSKDMKVIIPAGELPETERPGYVAPRTTTQSSSSYTAGSSSYMTGSVGNKYGYGYCTWYAYERRAAMGRPVGSFWGNANTWAAAARSQGFTVNNTPAAGAVLQASYGGGGYGHVGIIDSVNWEAGTVTYSDMNGIAGWNGVGTRTISISEAQSRWVFIH